MTYYLVPKRSEIRIGSKVKIAEKENYTSGEITEGFVKEILTTAPVHPRGIKVRLTSGIVGRVQALGDQTLKPLGSENLEIPTTTVVDYTPSEDELL